MRTRSFVLGLPLSGGGRWSSAEFVKRRFPEYVELANEINARRFNIPEEIWRGMTDAERWGANKKFLDRLIKRGDEVVLATPASEARAGSFFERELQYLQSKGYKLVDDGTRLVPGS